MLGLGWIELVVNDPHLDCILFVRGFFFFFFFPPTGGRGKNQKHLTSLVPESRLCPNKASHESPEGWADQPKLLRVI